MKLIVEVPNSLYANLSKIQLGSIASKRILDRVKKGIPLPKGHGRLIDADAFERRCMFDADIEDMQDVIYALRDYPTILEATKESTDADGERAGVCM